MKQMSHYFLTEVKDYFYDMDYNFYHKTPGDREGEFVVVKITREEYKRQTGESDYIIKKLRNSAWPEQGNDYYFYKSKSRKTGKTMYIPVDWKLINLIKYFNKSCLPTTTSEQGITTARIHFQSGSHLIPNLKILFGEENIKLVETSHDYRNGQWKLTEELKQLASKNKIVLVLATTISLKGDLMSGKRNRLLFNHKNSGWIHEKLGIMMPKQEGSHTGSRMAGRINTDILKESV